MGKGGIPPSPPYMGRVNKYKEWIDVADAGERALNALSRVDDIGFPEFTAKLVKESFL